MAFRSVTTYNNSVADGSENQVTLAKPAGTIAGDILVFTVAHDGEDTTTTWPTGFNDLGNNNQSGPDGQSFHAAWKLCGGSEPSTYTFTWDNFAALTAVLACFSGRKATGTITASSKKQDTTRRTSPISLTANTITAAAGDDIVWIAQLDVDNPPAGAHFTPPTGYTEQVDLDSTIWSALTLAVSENVAAGATGTVTGSATLTQGGAGWGTFLIAIAADTPSTTPVSKDSTIEWNILKALSKDLTLEWSILKAISTDKTLQWSILKTLSKDQTLEWNILKSINKDQTIEWSILKALSLDKTFQWSILQSASKDSTIEWNILKALAKDSTLEWSVLKALAIDKAFDWALLGGVSKDLTAEWSIIKAISRDLELRWDADGTVTTINKDFTVQWSILKSLSKDYSLRWNINSGIAKDVTIEWSVVGVVNKQLTLRWSILSESQFPTIDGLLTIESKTGRITVKSIDPIISIH